jgi:hypothetical protein
MIELFLIQIFSPFVLFHFRSELRVLEELKVVESVRITAKYIQIYLQ